MEKEPLQPKPGRQLRRQNVIGLPGVVYSMKPKKPMNGPVPGTTYESDILAAAHELATDLHHAGVYDAQTMREFDAMCLTPIAAFGPDEIKQVRNDTGMSQAVFARILNVTVSTVGQWERGEKRPTGSALKLLSLAQKRGIDAIL